MAQADEAAWEDATDRTDGKARTGEADRMDGVALEDEAVQADGVVRVGGTVRMDALTCDMVNTTKMEIKIQAY